MNYQDNENIIVETPKGSLELNVESLRLIIPDTETHIRSNGGIEFELSANITAI